MRNPVRTDAHFAASAWIPAASRPSRITARGQQPPFEECIGCSILSCPAILSCSILSWAFEESRFSLVAYSARYSMPASVIFTLLLLGNFASRKNGRSLSLVLSRPSTGHDMRDRGRIGQCPAAARAWRVRCLTTPPGSRAAGGLTRNTTYAYAAGPHLSSRVVQRARAVLGAAAGLMRARRAQTGICVEYVQAAPRRRGSRMQWRTEHVNAVKETYVLLRPSTEY